MIHKKCGGKLVLDCTSFYNIQSPSIKITNKGLMPGVVEITLNKIKSNPRLICSRCYNDFSSKEEYENEITETCVICRKEFSPSKIKIISNSVFVCFDCCKKASSKSIDEGEDKLFYVFGEYLSKAEGSILLDVLIKKG